MSAQRRRSHPDQQRPDLRRLGVLLMLTTAGWVVLAAWVLS